MSGSFSQFASSLLGNLQFNLCFHYHRPMVELMRMDLPSFLTKRYGQVTRIWCHLMGFILTMHFPDITDYKFQHSSRHNTRCANSFWDIFYPVLSAFNQGKRKLCNYISSDSRSVPTVVKCPAALTVYSCHGWGGGCFPSISNFLLLLCMFSCWLHLLDHVVAVYANYMLCWPYPDMTKFSAWYIFILCYFYLCSPLLLYYCTAARPFFAQLMICHSLFLLLAPLCPLLYNPIFTFFLFLRILITLQLGIIVILVMWGPKPSCLVGAEFTTRPQPKRHKWMTGRSSISAYYIACPDQGPDRVAFTNIWWGEISALVA
jgi:hypothetical protein